MSSTLIVGILVSLSSILRIIYHFRLIKESPEEISRLQKFIFYASVGLAIVGLAMIISEII
ncbi:MAG: hypothetical protein RIE52_11675 [Balneola sp.]